MKNPVDSSPETIPTALLRMDRAAEQSCVSDMAGTPFNPVLLAGAQVKNLENAFVDSAVNPRLCILGGDVSGRIGGAAAILRYYSDNNLEPPKIVCLTSPSDAEAKIMKEGLSFPQISSLERNFLAALLKQVPDLVAVDTTPQEDQQDPSNFSPIRAVRRALSRIRGQVN